MSLDSVLQELQHLRRDLAVLGNRVSALEQRSAASGLGSPVTVNYTIPGAQFGEVPPFPSFSPPGGSSHDRGTPQSVNRPSGRASEYTEEERKQIALDAGAFLRRSLDGDCRGESGRDRLRLPSAVYILCRDYDGNLYDPVQIHRKFSTLRPLVKRGSDCGDSIFIGFPTLWEAGLCVRQAGLTWPTDA